MSEAKMSVIEELISSNRRLKLKFRIHDSIFYFSIIFTWSWHYKKTQIYGKDSGDQNAKIHAKNNL